MLVAAPVVGLLTGFLGVGGGFLVVAGSVVQPDWWLVLALTGASAVGGYAGARVADHTDTRKLSGAFTVLMLMVAVYTAARALPALISSPVSSPANEKHQLSFGLYTLGG